MRLGPTLHEAALYFVKKHEGLSATAIAKGIAEQANSVSSALNKLAKPGGPLIRMRDLETGRGAWLYYVWKISPPGPEPKTRFDRVLVESLVD